MAQKTVHADAEATNVAKPSNKINIKENKSG